VEILVCRRRHDFELPLDLRLAAGFRRIVLDRLLEVPYGATASYAEMAALAGNPRAVRAAGSACSHAPPCRLSMKSAAPLPQRILTSA
jgi:methylated-DNA-[protein]-cysteine S-methyltransferase